MHSYLILYVLTPHTPTPPLTMAPSKQFTPLILLGAHINVRSRLKRFKLNKLLTITQINFEFVLLGMLVYFPLIVSSVMFTLK